MKKILISFADNGIVCDWGDLAKIYHANIDQQKAFIDDMIASLEGYYGHAFTKFRIRTDVRPNEAFDGPE